MNFIYFTLVGLGVGAIYGLVALSIVLLFNGSGLFNFAQGDFVMVGGMAAVVSLQAGLPYVLAIVVAVLVTAAVAAAVGVMTHAPLRKGRYDLDVILLGTIGVSIVLGNVVTLTENATYSLPSLTGGAALRLGTLSLPMDYVLLIGAAAAISAAIKAIYSFTNLGLMLRAVAMDFEAATVSGVRTGFVITLTWVMVGVVGGISGVLIGTVSSVTATMGIGLTLAGLAGAVMGGMHSSLGALLGGLVLGLGETYAGAYSSGALQQLIGPILILVILVLRPTGLTRVRIRQRKV